MDPNATLVRIRKLALKATRNTESYLRPLNDDETQELAELIAALDDWLSSGGFLPDEWKEEE